MLVFFYKQRSLVSGIYPLIPLSSAEASLILRGDWGEGNIKAHGGRWEGEEGEGKPRGSRLFLLPITPRAPLSLSESLCGGESVDRADEVQHPPSINALRA